jgi:hypothetical protein
MTPGFAVSAISACSFRGIAKDAAAPISGGIRCDGFYIQSLGGPVQIKERGLCKSPQNSLNIPENRGIEQRKLSFKRSADFMVLRRLGVVV